MTKAPQGIARIRFFILVRPDLCLRVHVLPQEIPPQEAVKHAEQAQDAQWLAMPWAHRISRRHEVLISRYWESRTPNHAYFPHRQASSMTLIVDDLVSNQTVRSEIPTCVDPKRRAPTESRRSKLGRRARPPEGRLSMLTDCFYWLIRRRPRTTLQYCA